MNITTAKQAGEIAAALERRYALRATIQKAIAEDWRITDVRAENVNGGGGNASLVLDVLDASTSEQGLSYILGIYDAQIAALEAELAGLA